MSRTLLVGLPGAGKSTLAARLVGPVVALDDIRRATSDATPAGDYHARSLFFRECQERQQAVFEFNGAGSHRHAARLALSMVAVPLRIVYLRVPVDMARRRVAERGTHVPHPNYGVDAVTAFGQMAETLERDFAEGYWSARADWVAIALDGTLSIDELTNQLEVLS